MAGRQPTEKTLFDRLCENNTLPFVMNIGSQATPSLITVKRFRRAVRRHRRHRLSHSDAAKKQHADSGEVLNPETGRMVSALWNGSLGEWMRQNPEEASEQRRLGGLAKAGLAKAGRWTEQYEAEGKKDYLVLVVSPHSECQREVLRSTLDSSRSTTSHWCTDCKAPHMDWVEKEAYDEEQRLLRENGTLYRCPKCSHVFRKVNAKGTVRCPKKDGGCSHVFRASNNKGT